jgi:hypothetical protein
MTTSQPDPMDHDHRVAQPQAAVQRAAAGGTEWALAIDQLAEAWLAANDLDRAIATRRIGLTGLASEAAHYRADLQHNLGVDLMTRYRRHSRPADCAPDHPTEPDRSRSSPLAWPLGRCTACTDHEPAGNCSRRGRR